MTNAERDLFGLTQYLDKPTRIELGQWVSKRRGDGQSWQQIQDEMLIPHGTARTFMLEWTQAESATTTAKDAAKRRASDLHQKKRSAQRSARDERIRTIIQMREQGTSMPQIAKTLGVSASRVTQLLEEHRRREAYNVQETKRAQAALAASLTLQVERNRVSES